MQDYGRDHDDRASERAVACQRYSPFHPRAPCAQIQSVGEADTYLSRPQAGVGGRRVCGRQTAIPRERLPPTQGAAPDKKSRPCRGGYVGLAYFVALRSVGRFVLFPLTLSGSVVFCASCLARKASMSKKKTSVRSSSLFQTAHTSR